MFWLENLLFCGLVNLLMASGTTVPGGNCGITVPFRVIRPGDTMKDADIPCTLIYDKSVGQKLEKTIPLWGDYTPWTECSKTCGGGSKSRTRECFLDGEKVDESQCEGSPIRFLDCNTHLCTVPTQWSDWSTCPITCGDGLQIRSRQCTDILANEIVSYEHCEKLHPGETSTQSCDVPPCAGWSEWAAWSKCAYNVTGETIARSRECIHVSEGVLDNAECGGAADALEEEVCPDLKICPKEKPFVFNDGTSCCKVYYRTNTNAICDGGFLALEDPLECCPENEYEDCENEPGYCQDHSIASTYCPRYPDLLRGGDYTLINTNLKLPMLDASTHCVSNENGKLPDTLESKVFESFMAENPSFTLWTSLEKPFQSVCSGQTCENNSNIIWSDGSFLSNPEGLPIALTNSGGCGKLIISAGTTNSLKIETASCDASLNVVCMTSCRHSAPSTCPPSYPSAFNNGQSCCKDYKKMFKISVDPTCDGSDIKLDDKLECCSNSVPCEDLINGCESAPFSRHFCPAHPDMKRYGEFAMHVNLSVTLNQGALAEYCLDNFNTYLPMLKTLWDVEAFQVLPPQDEHFHLGADFLPGRQCLAFANCVDEPFYRWADGTPITDIGYNAFAVATSSQYGMARVRHLVQFFGTSEKKLAIACPVPCSEASIACPKDHPFATGGGSFCSKNFKRINDTSTNILCDGGLIQSDDPLECCDECVACPIDDAKCHNAANSNNFCPADNRAKRYWGDIGYIVMEDVSMNVEDASRYCHENLGARLPRSLNHTQLNLLFLRQYGSIEFWTSLETHGYHTCTNSDCVNVTSVRWEDGSMLKSTGDTFVTMGPYLCASIQSLLGGVTRIRMISKDCSTALKLVCEVFCSTSEPKYCPTSHQFAANNGQTCCNDYRRKFDVDTNPICDGTELLLSDPQECCLDFIQCPHSDVGCVDAPRSKKFCPVRPDAKRSSGHAFTIHRTSMNYFEAKEFCQVEEKGDLPIIKTPFDIFAFDEVLNGHDQFFVSATYNSGIACIGPSNCFGPPINLTWADGTPGELVDGLSFKFASNFESGLRLRLATKSFESVSKSTSLRVGCQTPCSQVAAYCPRSHPIATGSGGWCSKFHSKLFDPSVDPTCDGTKIRFEDNAACCKGCIRCPGNFTSCTNNQYIESYCEANPNATKFGLTAFTYLPELGLTNISTAGQACADIGGRLPLLKSGLVMSGIHDYFGSITIPPHFAHWIGLESQSGKTCSNAACTDSDTLFWSDGTSYTHFDGMALQTTHSRCHVLKNQAFLREDCTNFNSVVCEFVCDEETMICPQDHPFPIASGKACCNDMYKKYDLTLNPLCDGLLFTPEDPMECCPDPIPCSKPLCQNHPLQNWFCPLHPEGSRSGYSTAVLTNNSGNVLSQEEALLLCQTEHNASLLSLDHPLAFEHLYVGTNTENLRNWLDFTYGDNDTYQCNWSDECLKEVRRLSWPNGRPFIQMDLASELVTSNPSKPKFYFSQSRKIIQTTSSMTGNAICQKECFSIPESCPSDHPFATNRGQHCSKYYERLIGGPCEEGFLELADPIECCITCIPCPVTDRPCANAVNAKGYCPSVPEAVRSKNHVGFLVSNISGLLLGQWEAQDHCISNHNGHLPYVKDEQDIYVITNFFKSSTKLWMGATGPIAHVCNGNCDPLDGYKWWDGTHFPMDFFKKFSLAARSPSISIATNVGKPYDGALTKSSNPVDETICQISCGYYNGAICPEDHPFVHNGGESCCNHFTTTCAGNGFLSKTDGTDCCSTNVPCPHNTKKCQSHPNFSYICPQFPNSLRFGSRSFQVISEESTSTYAEAKLTCENLGGTLPIVKDIEVYEELTYVIKGKDLDITDMWASLENVDGVSCVNGACNNNNILWGDGTQFFFEDLNSAFRGFPAPKTCHSITLDRFDRTHLSILGAKDCTDTYATICQFTCQ